MLLTIPKLQTVVFLSGVNLDVTLAVHAESLSSIHEVPIIYILTVILYLKSLISVFVHMPQSMFIS